MPSGGELALDLYDEVTERLHKPEPELTPLDQNNGWALVQVPVDFRTSVASTTEIVLTASVDGPNPAWVTITARPSSLTYTPGDPRDDTGPVSCSIAEATAAYDPDNPGACSYTYRNSSAITATDTFQASVALGWDITYVSSDGPGSLDPAPTVTPIPLEVAEVKTFVTCTRDCDR